MTYSTNVSRAAVSDPNDLLAVVATWPDQWVARVVQPWLLEAVDGWTWCGRGSGVPGGTDRRYVGPLRDRVCQRHGR